MVKDSSMFDESWQQAYKKPRNRRGGKGKYKQFNQQSDRFPKSADLGKWKNMYDDSKKQNPHSKMDDKEMNELNQLFSMFKNVDQELVKDIFFGTDKKFEESLQQLLEIQTNSEPEEEEFEQIEQFEQIKQSEQIQAKKDVFQTIGQNDVIYNKPNFMIQEEQKKSSLEEDKEEEKYENRKQYEPQFIKPNLQEQQFVTPMGPPADQGELDFLIEMFEDELLTKENIRNVYDQQGFDNAFETLEDWCKDAIKSQINHIEDFDINIDDEQLAKQLADQEKQEYIRQQQLLIQQDEEMAKKLAQQDDKKELEEKDAAMAKKLAELAEKAEMDEKRRLEEEDAAMAKKLADELQEIENKDLTIAKKLQFEEQQEKIALAKQKRLQEKSELKRQKKEEKKRLQQEKEDAELAKKLADAKIQQESLGLFDEKFTEQMVIDLFQSFKQQDMIDQEKAQEELPKKKRLSYMERNNNPQTLFKFLEYLTMTFPKQLEEYQQKSKKEEEGLVSLEDILSKKFTDVKNKHGYLIDQSIQTLVSPNLIIAILGEAFPNHQREGNPGAQQQMDGMFGEGKRQLNRASDVPLNPSGRQEFQKVGGRGNGPFFTVQVVKHFMSINNNYYKGFQQQYEQFRSEPQIYQEQINEAKQLAFQARQQGDKEMSRKYMDQMRQLKDYHSQSQSVAEEKMFGLLNNLDTVNLFIDLHGQHKNTALNITQRTLNNIQRDLNNGSLEPNYKDGINHVFKIICGAGNHSKNGIPVLKVAIPKLLDQGNYEYYPIMNHGVFLVRLCKEIW